MNIPKPTKVVKLGVKPSGKAPRKQYGDNVFKFSKAQAHLMEKRGWSVVNKGSAYIYMRPAGDAGKPPFVIEVAILTEEQVLPFAKALDSVGRPWRGWIGEWAAWYTPPREGRTQEVDPFTGQQKGEPEVFVQPQVFQVGEIGFWDANVIWNEDGPHYYETTENILDGSDSWDDLPLFAGTEEAATKKIPPTEFHLSEELRPGDFTEGVAVRVEVNRYERDPEARAACIAHHGTRCLACGFDFEDFYGEIGHGFIHVHHVVPLSQIGSEYSLNPITDLVPVCPNCHAMLHRRSPPFAVEELRTQLQS